MNPQIPHFNSVDIKTCNAKKAIFLIGVRPTPALVRSLSDLTRHYFSSSDGYDVFFIADDDGQPFIHPDVNIMQVSKMECSSRGFQHLIMFHNTVPHNAHVSAWDKALYVASSLNSYDHYWFVEDDVVYSDLDIFSYLDQNHDHVDLMCRRLNAAPFFNNPAVGELLKNNWEINSLNAIPHRRVRLGKEYTTQAQKWLKLAREGQYKESIELYLKESRKYEWLVPLPHIHGPSQCIRFSRNLLNIIADFAATHNTLFCQEYIFYTLAYHNNLKIKTSAWTGGRKPTERELITAFDSHFKNFNNIEFFDKDHWKTDHLRGWIPPIENDASLTPIEKARRIFEKGSLKAVDFPFFYHPVKNHDVHATLRSLIKPEN